MQANMSVLGLYNYDNTLFANMAYPTGFTADDKSVLLNNLLAELAEMEVVYPRPDFMKSAIGFWSAKEVITWNRIYEAAKLEYNPIENYDRTEETTDTTEATRQHSGTDTITNSGKDTTQHSGTDSSTGTLDDTTQHSGNDVNASSGSDITSNTGSDITTNETAAFNSNSLVTHDKSTLAHGHGQTLQHGLTNTLTHGEKVVVDQDTTFSVTHGRKEELTHGHVEATQHGEKIEDDTETTRESRIHGNIGVTTSQQMLEQELEVAPKLNIMSTIIESFKNRFCLLVY